MVNINRSGTRNFGNAASGNIGNIKSKMNTKISRGQFIRRAGIAGGAVAAAGLGLSGVVKAQEISENPDPDNIVLPNGNPALGNAKEEVIIVYPTGETDNRYDHPEPPPTSDLPVLKVTRDLRNIQWAVGTTIGYPPKQDGVKLGGTVILKDKTSPNNPNPNIPMHFNFHNPLNDFVFFDDPSKSPYIRGVSIFNSMTLTGEPLAIIEGGSPPICASSGPSDDRLEQITIKNITLNNPILMGIYMVDGYANVSVESCKIINYKVPAPNVFTFGILSHSGGRLIVTGCEVQSHSDNSQANLDIGIFHMPYIGDNDSQYTEITGNTVRGVYAALPSRLYPDFVNAGPFQGIAVVNVSDNPQIKATISNNHVYAESGIACVAMNAGTEIMGNDIHGVKYFGISVGTGSPFWNSLDNSNVAGNIIELDGNLPQYGLQSYGIWIVSGSSNTFSENIISGNGDYGIVIDGESAQNKFYGNMLGGGTDSRIGPFPALIAFNAQVQIGKNAYQNYFNYSGANPNQFGPLNKSPASNAARIIVDGHDNVFNNDRYLGEVWSWEMGHGIWLMRPTASHNDVTVSRAHVLGIKPEKQLLDYWKDQSPKLNTFNSD